MPTCSRTARPFSPVRALAWAVALAALLAAALVLSMPGLAQAQTPPDIPSPPATPETVPCGPQEICDCSEGGIFNQRCLQHLCIDFPFLSFCPENPLPGLPPELPPDQLPDLPPIPDLPPDQLPDLPPVPEPPPGLPPIPPLPEQLPDLPPVPDLPPDQLPGLPPVPEPPPNPLPSPCEELPDVCPPPPNPPPLEELLPELAECIRDPRTCVQP